MRCQSGIPGCYWGNVIPEYNETQGGRTRSDGLRGQETEGGDLQVDLTEVPRDSTLSVSAPFCY